MLLVKGKCDPSAFSSDLLGSLLGAQVRVVLVGGRRLRADGGLVLELPQALGVVAHRAVVVPEGGAVGGGHGLRTPCRSQKDAE